MHKKDSSLIDEIKALGGFDNLVDSLVREGYTSIHTYSEIAYHIGAGVGGIEQSHKLLTAIHSTLNQNELISVAKGCIREDNMKSFSFLINNTSFDPPKKDTGLTLSLTLNKYKMASMLVMNGADLSILKSENYRTDITRLLSYFPDEKRKYYNCLFDINMKHSEGFMFSIKDLTLDEIPINVIKLIKEVADPYISLSILKKGIDYDVFNELPTT